METTFYFAVLAADAAAMKLILEFVEPTAIGERCMAFEASTFRLNPLVDENARALINKGDGNTPFSQESMFVLADGTIVRSKEGYYPTSCGVVVLVLQSTDELQHLGDDVIFAFSRPDRSTKKSFTFTRELMAVPAGVPDGITVCQFREGHALRNLVSVLCHKLCAEPSHIDEGPINVDLQPEIDPDVAAIARNYASKELAKLTQRVATCNS